MDEEAADLIRRLCTRIGAIMEDESLTALLWEDRERINIRDRLDRLEEAGRAISILAAAAKVLIHG